MIYRQYKSCTATNLLSSLIICSSYLPWQCHSTAKVQFSCLKTTPFFTLTHSSSVEKICSVLLTIYTNQCYRTNHHKNKYDIIGKKYSHQVCPHQKWWEILNPLGPNALILYHLKTSENRKVEKGCTGNKWIITRTFLQAQNSTRKGRSFYFPYDRIFIQSFTWRKLSISNNLISRQVANKSAANYKRQTNQQCDRKLTFWF